jgi:hypothetical protein
MPHIVVTVFDKIPDLLEMKKVITTEIEMKKVADTLEKAGRLGVLNH